MNLVDRLEELKENSNELIATQLQYMIEQVDNDYNENDKSSSGEEVESDYPDIEQGPRNQGEPIGETLLKNEFALNSNGSFLVREVVLESYERIPEDVLLKAKEPIKKKSGLKEMVIYPSDKVSMPMIVPLEKVNDEDGVPREMESRPKIPRTPIPEETLERVKKENEELKKNAMHIYTNEEANLKKQKIMRRYKPPQTAQRKNKEHPVIVYESIR